MMTVDHPFWIGESVHLRLASALSMTANQSIPVPGINSKLAGYTRAPSDSQGRRREWRLTCLHGFISFTVTTDLSTTLDALDLARVVSPINVVAAGFPRAPFLNARGDALWWAFIDRYGKAPSESQSVAASQTAAVVRIRFVIPFAGFVGMRWWDSAPRPGAIRSVTIGLNTADLPSGATSPSGTLTLWATLAPYHKTTLPRAFCFQSLRAPSDTEARIEAGQALHGWWITDTDDAFTGTDEVTQRTVGGKLLNETPMDLRVLAHLRNIMVLPDGGNGPNLVQIDESSPEMIPLYVEPRGEARALTKAIELGDGAHANFSGDVGGTLYHHDLTSYDIPDGSAEARDYRAATRIRPTARAVPATRGAELRRNVPQRLR